MDTTPGNPPQPPEPPPPTYGNYAPQPTQATGHPHPPPPADSAASGHPAHGAPPPGYWPGYYPPPAEGGTAGTAPYSAAPAGTAPYNGAPGYWGPPPQYGQPAEGVPPAYVQGVPYQNPYGAHPPPHGGAQAIHIGIPVEGAPAALKPSGTRVDVTRTDGALTVTIPRIGLRAVVPNLAFVFIWLVMIGLGLVMMILFSGPFFLIIFSLPFFVLGLWYLGDVVRNATLKETITIADGQFTFTRDVLGWKGTVKGSTRNLQYLELKLKRRWDRPDLEAESWCALIEGGKEHTFGRLTKLPEQQWILAELSVFLSVPVRHVQINMF